MLDWFTAHLHDDVKKLIVQDLGHCLLFHGGGVTGCVQPNDTHVHEPLSKEFKRLEQVDVCAQRRLDKSKIPRRSRQKVYDDCHLAWGAIDHDYVGPKSHLQDGWTLPLDGSRDHEIYHDLQPIWDALNMGSVRKKLIDEINRDVDSGIYTEWSQWPELLEDFPPHSTMREGQEGHRDRANPDDDDEDGDNGSEDGSDAGEESEEEDDSDSEEGSEEEDDDDGNDGPGDGGAAVGAEDAAAPASASGSASASGLGSGVGELGADVADTEIQASVPAVSCKLTYVSCIRTYA